ncbi:MAG TPA: hypothetical protein VGR57_14340 [Ktedonobacterales bacterium]|nr:hypothetical protein [Ktedonobacterales bacterium]
MDHDTTPPTPDEPSPSAAAPDTNADDTTFEARVRYGLGKELRLYPREIGLVQQEGGEELRLRLANIQRLILAPGEQVPSKLVLMFDLDDGTTMIGAEGMSNVRDFRVLLARLVELRPGLELDPPNMDEQLAQALEIRRRSLLGCYGSIALACVVLWVVYMAVALIPHIVPHAGH